MKGKSISVAIAALALSGVAQAHTHLKASVPADNAALTAAPGELALNFSEATRLTALSIQKEGDKDKKSIEALPKEAAAALKIPLAPLAPGNYTVNWRALSDDSHVMSGVLHFSIKAK